MNAEPVHPTLAVLRQRNVRFFVASRLCSATALTLLRATIFWQVFELTGSEFYLGLVGLVQFLPVVPLNLVGGAVADSFDRRRVVMGAQGAALLFSLLLYTTSRSGQTSLAVVFAAVFALQVASAFEGPSRSALLPALVPRELFPSAVAVHAAFQNLAWVAGPVVSGFAIDAGGVPLAYAIHMGLVIGSLANLAGVRWSRKADAPRALSARAVGEGIAFVRQRPAILGSMTLDMVAVILASVTALLPVYAAEILEVGPRGYGWLGAAVEMGALLAAVLLLVRTPIARPGRALLLAVGAFGFATVLFGLSRWFPLSMAALILAGMADQVSMVTRATIIQLSTPDSLRGRVSSVNLIFISASNQLGAAESGFLAALTGAAFSVVFGGVACVAFVVAIAARVPALRHYRPDRDAL